MRQAQPEENALRLTGRIKVTPPAPVIRWPATLRGQAALQLGIRQKHTEGKEKRRRKAETEHLLYRFRLKEPHSYDARTQRRERWGKSENRDEHSNGELLSAVGILGESARTKTSKATGQRTRNW